MKGANLTLMGYNSDTQMDTLEVEGERLFRTLQPSAFGLNT
jgi:hypothetical protein